MRTFWIIASLVFAFWLFRRESAPEESTPDMSAPKVQTEKLVPSATGGIDALTATARALEGRPYRGGGMSPTGFDCSGFVSYVFRQHGLRLPRSSAAMAQTGLEVDLEEVQPGDLLFFTGRDASSGVIGHVALVTGTESGHLHMTHACNRGVVTDNYWDMRYYQERLLRAVRPRVLASLSED
ncbi:MAG: NlpC/P60 family protein [Bacteroidetes bacterium]|nr:MAG: NlpC/P60 family protein [Bacteroidota bacterium]